MRSTRVTVRDCVCAVGPLTHIRTSAAQGPRRRRTEGDVSHSPFMALPSDVPPKRERAHGSYFGASGTVQRKLGGRRAWCSWGHAHDWGAVPMSGGGGTVRTETGPVSARVLRDLRPMELNDVTHV